MTRTQHLMKYLIDNNVRFSVISHMPAYTAHQVAVATHVDQKELAKTILINADGQYWMAVLRADERIDESKLKRALEVHHATLAHEEDLDDLFPGCELGAMPPFGKLYGLPVVMDRSLAEDKEIVFNACTHTEAIRMSFEDYVRLADPFISSFAETTEMFST